LASSSGGASSRSVSHWHVWYPVDEEDKAALSCSDGPVREMCIPASHADAVMEILACTNGRSIKVADLTMPNDAERMDLVLMLHGWGVLSIPSSCASQV
jgi:hypothetical protein